MSNPFSSFLIAAPRSNSGKTIITLGLIHALVKRGLKVQPFKCGPDYIDPMHHAVVSGNPSYNLDTWMSDENHVHQIYNKYASSSNVAIVEGVMGLFDGAKKDQGSSAKLAETIDIPVVLVVDSSSMAYSAAPLLYGFKNFNKKLKIAGVIFNKVASATHYQFLKEAAIDAGVESLGYIPRDKKLSIESRHLGLHLPTEQNNIAIVEHAAMHIEQQIDIDKLLTLTQKELPQKVVVKKQKKQLTVALAHDAAFNFSYPANLDSLNKIATVVKFSPLKDKYLPSCDLLWLPGGYPELFAVELEQNKSMKEYIKAHIEAGKALIAECGGMMYLGNSIITKEDKSFKMAAIFDVKTSFSPQKLHLGYRQIVVDGFEVRGHEFHYSHILGDVKHNSYGVKSARGKDLEMPVLRYKNCWASYMHIYLGQHEKLKVLLNHLNINLE